MKCEKCQNEHNGSFGSGRFCSRACANSRTFSKESRIKKSIATKNYYRLYPHESRYKGYKHSIEMRKKLSIIAKEKIKNGAGKNFIGLGNSYPRKLELKYKGDIEKYFCTKNLKPKKIGKHWFDFVNDDFIIEFTIDKTAGISDAIKRFQTIINDKRKKYLIANKEWFGKQRLKRLNKTNAIFIELNKIAP